MTYVIGLACVDNHDRTCIGQCPVDCIYEGDRMLYIHPGECVDCGACEPACPVEAIALEADVPAGQEHFTPINAKFTAGARTADGRDHPAVAALPPPQR